MIQELSQRNREIFRQLVEAYMETGEPIGSHTLAKKLGVPLSPATIRNVMAELQDAGLLFSPHTSAGRVPTPQGLSFFVDGLLEVGNLTEDERRNIEGRIASSGRSVEDLLGDAAANLSGLSNCAGLVIAPKQDARLRHIEFVGLSCDRVLIILVTEDGQVENRVLETPAGWTPSTLIEATNYLSARARGRTLGELRAELLAEQERQKREIDALASRLIDSGLAVWSGPDDRATLIVRGRANLLEESNAADLDRLRALFDALETRRGIAQLLELTRDAAGVRIFIGAANNLFNAAGCSVIVAPYMDNRNRIIGAIGVIGPTRLNYARIVPMVDYAAKIIGRRVGQRDAAA